MLSYVLDTTGTTHMLLIEEPSGCVEGEGSEKTRKKLKQKEEKYTYTIPGTYIES